MGKGRSYECMPGAVIQEGDIAAADAEISGFDVQAAREALELGQPQTSKLPTLPPPGERPTLSRNPMQLWIPDTVAQTNMMMM